MRFLIINILPHPPAYEYLNNEYRPPIYWNTTDDSWIGLFRGDWAELIGNEVLKISDDIQYEVWRPDYRADRVYSQVLENGLIYKIFPARKLKKLYGFKLNSNIYSPELLRSLKERLKEKPVLHLNGAGNFINREIIKNFPDIPKLIQFHSRLSTPYLESRKIRKNLAGNINHYINHKRLLRNRKVFFIYNNSTGISTLKKYNSHGIDRIFMGCDFDFWRPGNKNDAKKWFKIKPDTRVFSMASRFFPLKQIDQIIKIFTSLDKEDNFNFKLLIAGHGEKDYEEYLKNEGENLLAKGKLEFTGFLNDQDMLKLYQASDLFISASKYEGGPVSVVKALACNAPVMATRVNGVDDIMNELDEGILVSPNDYGEWEEQIRIVLDGSTLFNSENREKVKDLFDWAKIADKFVKIYHLLRETD